MKNTRDIYEEVTNKIISMLENGVAPWKCTWSKYGFARNYESGHIYTGINMLLMNCTSHPIPYFMTFKQAQKAGGHIKKGAKSEQIFYYNMIYKDEAGNKLTQQEARTLIDKGIKLQVSSFLKYYNVFAIEDIKGIDFTIDHVELKENEKIAYCEEIINNMVAPPQFKFVDSDRAFYSSELDLINMPDIKQFDSSQAYYATYFHELTHSTGHESRLARLGITDQKVKFGDSTYSKEELIAEMGASFLCAYANIDNNDVTENSAAYLQGWLKILKQDKKLIFKAAAEASKAVSLILRK